MSDNNRQKINEKVNEKTLIATVDIGKRTHTGYWRAYNGAEGKVFSFSNNRSGFEYFLKVIYAAKSNNKADTIIVGFESTGPYGKPLIHYLVRQKVRLVQVNSYHIKRVKELNDNSPLKSDIKDPRVIADIIQLGHFLSPIVPMGVAAELRELIYERETLIRYKTAAYNRLQNILSVVFPEFLSIMKGARSKCAHFLLQKYQTPQKIAELGIKQLTKIIRSISRGRISVNRIEELYNASIHSIGVKEGTTSMAKRIQNCLEHITMYNRQIDSLENDIAISLTHHPSSRFLLSIKGVNVITAAALIGEVGDFECFRSYKTILKLAGLNLYEVSSGSRRGRRYISKRGRHLLRKILFYASINAIRKHGILRSYYQRLLCHHMPRIKAIIAVMRKLVCIMFALVRNKTIYNPEYSKLKNTVLKQVYERVRLSSAVLRRSRTFGTTFV